MAALKIALVSEEFPPFTFGGISSACHDLAYALSREGVSTTVFCGRAEKLSTERINDYLDIVRLPCMDIPPRFFWFQLQNLKTFSNLFNKFQLLHIVNPEAGATTAYLGKKLKKPVVTSIHGVYLYPLAKKVGLPFSSWSFDEVGMGLLSFPLHNFLMNKCLKSSSRIAVCSRSTVAEMKSLYPYLDLKKVSVIPNGINFEEIVHRSNSDNSAEEELIIFYGRLIRLKGVEYLLKAVALLKEEFPKIRLQIFGDGPFRDKINKFILDLDLSNHVEVQKFIPRTELWKRIDKASIVVLPSLHEAQPVAVLEAMAFAKPVIVFDYPFSREVVANMQNGLLVKPADIADLCDKIRRLLKNKNLRNTLGRNANEYVKNNHNWNILVQKYIQLYKDAITDFSYN